MCVCFENLEGFVEVKLKDLRHPLPTPLLNLPGILSFRLADPEPLAICQLEFRFPAVPQQASTGAFPSGFLLW